jgi:hypothetical protein
VESFFLKKKRGTWQDSCQVEHGMKLACAVETRSQLGLPQMRLGLSFNKQQVECQKIFM